MSSLPSDVDRLLKANEILSQMGVEMAFIADDQDVGLLPINSFMMDLDELLVPGAPQEIIHALSQARSWLDQILDGPGKFSQVHIHSFNEWHPWMTAALADWEASTPMPAPPSSWLKSSPMPSSPPPAPAPAKVAPKVDLPKKPAPLPLPNETPIILNLAEDLDLLKEFHSESIELLQNIEQGVLVLEGNPTDANTINSIFRAFHTFKGGAGFLRLEPVQKLAHELESLLDAARQGKLTVNSAVIDLILGGADVLKQFTLDIDRQLRGTQAGEPIHLPVHNLILRVQATLKGEPAPAATPSAPTPSTSTPALSTNATEPASKTIQVAAPAKAVATTETTSSGFVKIDTGKLDNLVDLVGELIIAQSMVVQNSEVQGLNDSQLTRCLRQLSRTTSELQRNTLSLRMVPMGGAFHKMTRLVRDIASQQGKQVQLVLEGEETELDRNIVEKLGDPLVHMIRNAVDHGLEYPGDRIKAGKPAIGTVRLVATHRGGGIIIQIQDDGKGLNPDRILAKAQERGLISPGAQPTPTEIFDMIFLPGFSTAEKVTDLSGRGVGMDVVRRNIEALRGKVTIDSTLGEGTTFTIHLPLTLAIIDGLIVRVGKDRYIIPTLSVLQSFRPAPGMVTSVHERGEVVGVRGLQVPVLRLGRYLGGRGKTIEPEEGILIVVESGDASRALLVDELVGKQEVVIKSLGHAFRDQTLLAGAAVLGDGSVGLILDVDTLVRLPDQRAPSPHSEPALLR